LLAYSVGYRTFYLYGFEKGDRDNITQKEKKMLRILGESLLQMDDTELSKRLKSRAIKEIKEQ
jgi:hypothetical protein